MINISSISLLKQKQKKKKNSTELNDLPIFVIEDFEDGQIITTERLHDVIEYNQVPKCIHKKSFGVMRTTGTGDGNFEAYIKGQKRPQYLLVVRTMDKLEEIEKSQEVLYCTQIQYQ